VRGCCTISALGHMIQAWTANLRGTPTTVPDSAIDTAYDAVKIGMDGGANMLDALNYYAKTGIGGHKDIGYVAVNLNDLPECKAALYIFGGTYVGVGLPSSASTQLNKKAIWDIPAGQKLTGSWAPGSWGGHAMSVVAYGPNGVGFVTWGAVQWCTWRWWQTYVVRAESELYALISSPDDWWDSATLMAANNIDYRSLRNNLADIAGKPRPYPDPVPVPTPPAPQPPVPPSPEPTPVPVPVGSDLRVTVSSPGFVPVTVVLAKA